MTETFNSHMRVMREVTQLESPEVPSLATPFKISPHNKMRETTLKFAIDEGFDIIFSIDDDIEIPEGTYEKLKEVLFSRPNVGMVSGSYLRKGGWCNSVWSQKIGDEAFNLVVPETGVFEISGTGMGCVLVNVNWVRDSINQPWFHHKKGTELAIEDLVFCERIIDAGGVVLGVADIKCPHYGRRLVVTEENALDIRAKYVTEELDA